MTKEQKTSQVNGMTLTSADMRYLMYVEKWLNYSQKTGAISLDDIISQDHRKGGNNFSTMLSEEDTQVHSFGLKNIPKANAILVMGNNLRAALYAAEIAIRHDEKYGYLPELVTVGDGRGMFRQRRDMAKCFADIMVMLGFDEDWATCNLIEDGDKDRDYQDEVIEKLNGIFCRHKLKVLVVTPQSLLPALELPKLMPSVDFNFFEMPQVETKNRWFDAERFACETYAVDSLLAKAITAQLRTQKRLELPVEKKLDHPCKRIMKDLILRGYAGCITKTEMWEFVNIPAGVGEKLRKERLVQLQKLSPHRFDKHIEKLLLLIHQRFQTKGLTIG